MRTSSLIAAIGLALLGSGVASALDVAARPPTVAPVAPIAKYSSAREALRDGMRDYNAGDKRGAARALEYAATQGHTLALWKLGRMYAEGDGVQHDDLKAFEYFSKAADQGSEDGPDSPNAAAVSNAFVALGTYFLEGIKGTYVSRSPQRAQEMFHYAASYYGDSNAQYHLGRLYLEGTGVAQDPRQAARWFNLAAEKGHHAAQALLGQLLVNGQGVLRQRARGLMWLILAREAADPTKDQWIAELYEKAFAAAGETDRQDALAMLEQYIQARR